MTTTRETIAMIRMRVDDDEAMGEWLADYSARVWDEGYEAGDPYHRRGDPAWSDNPYRAGDVAPRRADDYYRHVLAKDAYRAGDAGGGEES